MVNLNQLHADTETDAPVCDTAAGASITHTASAPCVTTTLSDASPQPAPDVVRCTKREPEQQATALPPAKKPRPTLQEVEFRDMDQRFPMVSRKLVVGSKVILHELELGIEGIQTRFDYMLVVCESQEQKEIRNICNPMVHAYPTVHESTNALVFHVKRMRLSAYSVDQMRLMCQVHRTGRHKLLLDNHPYHWMHPNVSTNSPEFSAGCHTLVNNTIHLLKADHLKWELLTYLQVALCVCPQMFRRVRSMFAQITSEKCVELAAVQSGAVRRVVRVTLDPGVMRLAYAKGLLTKHDVLAGLGATADTPTYLPDDWLGDVEFMRSALHKNHRTAKFLHSQTRCRSSDRSTTHTYSPLFRNSAFVVDYARAYRTCFTTKTQAYSPMRHLLGPEQKNDAKLMCQLVRIHPSYFQMASKELRGAMEFVKPCVELYPALFAYVTPQLQAWAMFQRCLWCQVCHASEEDLRTPAFDGVIPFLEKQPAGVILYMEHLCALERRFSQFPSTRDGFSLRECRRQIREAARRMPPKLLCMVLRKVHGVRAWVPPDKFDDVIELPEWTDEVFSWAPIPDGRLLDNAPPTHDNSVDVGLECGYSTDEISRIFGHLL